MRTPSKHGMRTLVSAAGEITDMEGNLPATMAQHGACADAAMMLARMLPLCRRACAGVARAVPAWPIAPRPGGLRITCTTARVQSRANACAGLVESTFFWLSHETKVRRVPRM